MLSGDLLRTYGFPDDAWRPEGYELDALAVVGAPLQLPGRDLDPVILVEALVEVNVDLWLT